MRLMRVAAVCVIALLTLSGPVLASADGAFEKKIYDDVKPSLVAVKYSWESELGSHPWTAAGVVISPDGLVMFSINMVTPQAIPESQIKHIKIILPSDTEDETEIDAVLVGRDERSNLAFVRATTPQKWKPVQFVDEPMNIGDSIYSIGILPKGCGYRSYVTAATISAKLRGQVPQVLVDGALANVGGVVFNEKEQAIGFIFPRTVEEMILDNPQNPADLTAVTSPPKLFVPAYDFLPGLADLPTSDTSLKFSWLGCELKGLDKEVADFFDLKNKPSVQVGDVVPGSPADKAGLKPDDIIVKMDGKPLERGDMPTELPGIIMRKVLWLKPGSTMKFSVVHQKGDVPKEITVTLQERPMLPTAAHRFFAQDLGFVARDVVFYDTYRRKLKQDTSGVVIATHKPRAAAAAANLQDGDLVTQMNGKPVTDLDEFKKDYLQFRKDKPQDPVVLVVSQPDGKEETINIEPPQAGTPTGDQ